MVAVRRRRAPLAGLSPLPGRRPHAHAGRRAGAGDQRAHRGLHPAAADLRPLARGRPRRPPARRADQRGMDRSLGRAPARRRGRPADRDRGRRDRLRARSDRRGDGRPPRHARDRDRRPLRRGDAGRAAAPAPQPRAGPGRAAPGRDPPPAHALDERGHVLPAPRRADPGRAHHLQRLRLGADLDLAASVLAAHRLRRPRATDTSAASCRSTCPIGSARRDARARWPRSAAPTRSRPRCGRS